MKRSNNASLVALVSAALLLIGAAPSARACGCFTPPTVDKPIVQAGERILFSVKNGQVTAHIQIQYQGDAKDFGWLLPLPSLPTLEVGTDDLFKALDRSTQPTFTVNTNPCYAAASAGSSGCGSSASGDASTVSIAHGAESDAGMTPSPLVASDSIGPYDYAVLKADDKSAMLGWLEKNSYFVPTGTDGAVNQYTHPGAYFLALKLHSGKSAGDVQPVVVHYASDLPMIPIVLTSVGAVPHMGILVYVVGQARAIPRNYSHVVLDVAAIDWAQGGTNYNDVLIRAVAEAPKKRAFVTQYAGAGDEVVTALRASDRLALLDKLRALSDPFDYVNLIKNYQLANYPFTGAMRALLQTNIPEPVELSNMGVTAEDFASTPDVWIQKYRQLYPNGKPIPFDAAATTAQVKMRVVDPVVAASDLLSANRKLTRLYTTLSPEDMTLDPVFSFNPDLPDVSQSRVFDLNQDCHGNAVLVTGDGFNVPYPNGVAPANIDSLPAALRIETLREAGKPEVTTDNTDTIRYSFGPRDAGGCRVQSRPLSIRGDLLLIVITLSFTAGSRRRRLRLSSGK